MAVKNGVLVLNEPSTLTYAIHKMYIQEFPEAVRVQTLITRSVEKVREFHKEHNRKVVIKPLQGYGGEDVFLLKEDATNLNQMVEAIGRNGYVIAQEYLEESKEGNIRLMMLNGKPLVYKNHYGAVQRVSKNGNHGHSTVSVKVKID